MSLQTSKTKFPIGQYYIPIYLRFNAAEQSYRSVTNLRIAFLSTYRMCLSKRVGYLFSTCFKCRVTKRLLSLLYVLRLKARTE